MEKLFQSTFFWWVLITMNSLLFVLNYLCFSYNRNKIHVIATIINLVAVIACSIAMYVHCYI